MTPITRTIASSGTGRSAAASDVCVLTVSRPGGQTGPSLAEPLTVGVPVPAGLCRDAAAIRMEAGDGGDVPLDARPLEYWPDGSIRWVLVDFQGVPAEAYRLHFTGGAAQRTSAGCRIDRDPHGLTVDTGAARFAIAAHGPFTLRADGGAASGARAMTIVASEPDGTAFNAEIDGLDVDGGVLRTLVTVHGTLGEGARRPLRFTARLHLFAGQPTIACELTVTNPARARHAGGFWQLGDPHAVMLKELAVRVADSGGVSRAWCSPEPGLPALELGPAFELYQDSSGGANWRSPVHRNRDGVVTVTFRGYRLAGGAMEHYGLRATPLVWTSGPAGTTAVGVPAFWQNCPRRLAADRDGLRLSLFPAEYGDSHELQPGEQKTHEFRIAFGDARPEDARFESLRQPAMAAPGPTWYARARAVPYLTPAATDPNTGYLALVEAAIDGPDSLEAKRERIDEYGWRNFGDIYADHEAVAHTGPDPLVSHYNNQYDAVAGMACQFMRSGDRRWLTAMRELAAHVIDIDLYHTAGDKAAYNGGLFWHTFHYRDAGLASHRSYPKAPGIGGGGPSNEHAYSTGLLLHYLMTGSGAARDAAIGLADWVYRMDDGDLTVFRWLYRGATGLASSTGSPEYHGPGRGAGNVIAVLLNGYRLTSDRKYLDKAETLIRRSVNPADDIAARDLPNAELRWSYTVFLQTLGRYLDEKALRGELDAMYGYARASLLHYARWMADHEYPYLDKPEILEYPTETWAAQDMRKSDVFKFAALHAAGEDRARFLERAEFFFRSSVGQLTASPTRALARPLVILMSYGFMHAAFQAGAAPTAPPAPEPAAFAPPAAFVPQKAVAMHRARRIAVAGAAGGVTLFALAALRLLGWL